MPPPTGFINLTEAPRSVQLFKINGFAASKEKQNCSIASTRTSVGGCDWEISYHPSAYYSNEYWIKFRITLLDSGGDADGVGLVLVVASFAGRLVDHQDGEISHSSQAPPMSAKLCKGHAKDLFVMSRNKLASSGYVKDDSILVELVITVLLDKPEDGAAAVASVAPPSSAAAPLSDLHKHFGELWRIKRGTDVTFVVGGEDIAAHRCVLAARSPVFMAELFGDMKETASKSVEIEDMDPEVFRALVQFIYTDTSPPELEGQEEEAKAMAQHLLAAADRYGMERLKLICEETVCGDISVGTAASQLVLAEQHGCPKLKAMCMEFMVATPANLRAVVATDGYKHLMASCPSVLSDLLLAVVQRNK